MTSSFLAATSLTLHRAEDGDVEDDQRRLLLDLRLPSQLSICV